MWRNAVDPGQKRAILDQLLPLTKEDYIDAVIHFAEDTDDGVRGRAFEQLKSIAVPDLIRRISPKTSPTLIRVFARLCVANPHPGLIARLLNSKRLPWSLVTELWLTPQEHLWQALIANRGFIVFSHPASESIAGFLASFNAPLAAAYREQVGWITEKELREFVRPLEKDHLHTAEPSSEKPVAPTAPVDISDGGSADFDARVIIKGIDSAFEIDGVGDEFIEEGQELDVSGALFDTGQGPILEEEEVVDLDSVELDVPDFLLTETAFEGFTREEMTEQRKKIAEIIDSLSMGQRIKLATLGNLEARRLLIKDPRRQVAMAVLGNGGITPGEIAGLAGNPATFQDVVEHIANNRTLSKSYMVKLAIVMNPKTPVKTSMRFLEVVRRADLKKVASSKNISPIIRNMAGKRMH